MKMQGEFRLRLYEEGRRSGLSHARSGAGHRGISPARAALQLNFLRLGAVESGQPPLPIPFLNIFDYALHNPNLKNVSDHAQRRSILLNDLFLVTCKRNAWALFHRDHAMLAVLLARTKLRSQEEITAEYESLLESGEVRLLHPEVAVDPRSSPTTNSIVWSTSRNLHFSNPFENTPWQTKVSGLPFLKPAPLRRIPRPLGTQALVRRLLMQARLST
jgi:hypothetical protein